MVLLIIVLIGCTGCEQKADNGLQYCRVTTRGRAMQEPMSEDFLLPGRWQVCVYTSTGQEEGWNGNFHRHVSKNRTRVKKKKKRKELNSWLNDRDAHLPVLRASPASLWLVRLLERYQKAGMMGMRHMSRLQIRHSVCAELWWRPWETTLCPSVYTGSRRR